VAGVDDAAYACPSSRVDRRAVLAERGLAGGRGGDQEELVGPFERVARLAASS